MGNTLLTILEPGNILVLMWSVSNRDLKFKKKWHRFDTISRLINSSHIWIVKTRNVANNYKTRGERHLMDVISELLLHLHHKVQRLTLSDKALMSQVHNDR